MDDNIGKIMPIGFNDICNFPNKSIVFAASAASLWFVASGCANVVHEFTLEICDIVDNDNLVAM